MAHLSGLNNETLVLAPAQGPTRQQQALQCRALELQLWATLPSFASWASDTAVAFPCAFI